MVTFFFLSYHLCFFNLLKMFVQGESHLIYIYKHTQKEKHKIKKLKSNLHFIYFFKTHDKRNNHLLLRGT